MRGAWKHLLSDALLQPWYHSGEFLYTLHYVHDSDVGINACIINNLSV